YLPSPVFRDDYVEQTGSPEPRQSAAGSARDGAQSDDAGRLSSAGHGQSEGGPEPEIHKERRSECFDGHLSAAQYIGARETSRGHIHPRRGKDGIYSERLGYL